MEIIPPVADMRYQSFLDKSKQDIASSGLVLGRSFPSCSYDLWLNCCREIRDGHLQEGGKEVIMEYVSRGLYYLHGGKERVELLPETSPKRSVR
ncbi:hypothetical protein L3X38_001144 [Prunus dulcis]|uniref:Uncharacterized protein n=1 Tax=Prunus dulcis TaxID=3755 RepID=A0AAD4WTZ7_PRUDU|nr:hypothetical protein L3X38_001144 [Prunus dulcis]